MKTTKQSRKTQLELVHELMLSGNWFTIEDVAARTGASLPGASARIRDLRKPRFGGYTIERRVIANGVFEYRLAAEVVNV
jgi:hypothetical protein